MWTTFRKVKQACACAAKYQKMAAHLGGEEAYGMNTPISVLEILRVCGLDDALWTLRIVEPEAMPLVRALACDFAEHVLPLWERQYPEDTRPRWAIEVARRYASGKASKVELNAARAAAGDAARAATKVADAAWAAARVRALATAKAARVAAGDAAGDAAWDAERLWQEGRLKVYLSQPLHILGVGV